MKSLDARENEDSGRSARSVWNRRLGLLGAVLLALAALGCSGSSEPEEVGLRVVGKPVTRELSGRLVVLGVDGLPPAFLREAIARGVAPSFEKLAAEGVFGEIDVLPAGLPPLSPRIWTSYSTGQLPDVHGLKSFVHSVDEREVLSNSKVRKVPAIWNIATRLGRSIGVVNWWATAPTERVKGFIISDLYNDVVLARLAKRFDAALERDADRVVYPTSLMERLRSVVPVDRMIKMSVQRAEEVDASVMELALVALDAHPVEIFLVYTRAFDELAHAGWPTHDRLPGEHFDDDLMIEYIERYDWLLARFLRHVRAEDHLMLLSDHGFERRVSERGLGGGHESAATAKAVLMMRGPRIQRGVTLADVDILDVMPTMLELAGLPAADDMPGRIAAEAFVPGERFLPRVESYALLGAGEDTDSESIGDDAMKERLRALGYLDGE